MAKRKTSRATSRRKKAPRARTTRQTAAKAVKSAAKKARSRKAALLVGGGLAGAVAGTLGRSAVRSAVRSVTKSVAKSLPKAAKRAAAPKGKWVYFFGDGRAEGRADMRELLGGKGAGLAEMANLGLPVPPGFTITTELYTYYYAHAKQYPKDLEAQVNDALARVGKITHDGLDDPKMWDTALTPVAKPRGEQGEPAQREHLHRSESTPVASPPVPHRTRVAAANHPWRQMRVRPNWQVPVP